MHTNAFLWGEKKGKQQVVVEIETRKKIVTIINGAIANIFSLGR